MHYGVNFRELIDISAVAARELQALFSLSPLWGYGIDAALMIYFHA